MTAPTFNVQRLSRTRKALIDSAAGFGASSFAAGFLRKQQLMLVTAHKATLGHRLLFKLATEILSLLVFLASEHLVTGLWDTNGRTELLRTLPTLSRHGLNPVEVVA